MPLLSLSKPWKITLVTGRVVLWLVFIVGLSAFAFSILFPSQEFVFDFENSKAQKNTLRDPRSVDGVSQENGLLENVETLIIDASAFGDFSTVSILLSGSDDALPLSTGTVAVRRSQKSFFYPEGNPAGFPKGTLIRFEDTFFHIAPNGTRKRFSSEETVRSLGLDPASFLVVSSEELFKNRDGGLVDVSGTEPPSGSFIRSEDTFYEWRNGKLIPFVSREAYLARFPENWAISKDTSFVESHTVSDDWRSFPSGSLLAWGDGVFLMDGETPRPILGIDIFLSLGFSWEDVRPVNDEEISLVQKGKFVDFSVPHPDGTVLFDTIERRYFLVEEKKRREIKGDAILRSWLGDRTPIPVSSESLTIAPSCALEEGFSPFSSYALNCSLPLSALDPLPGDTYQFSIDLPANTDIGRIDISFGSSVRGQTLFKTLSKFKSRIFSRYLPAS